MLNAAGIPANTVTEEILAEAQMIHDQRPVTSWEESMDALIKTTIAGER